MADPIPDNRRLLKKAIILLAGLILLGTLAALPPVRHFILDNQPRVKQFIRDCGPWAPLVFTLGVAVLVGIGFPRLACHFMGGVLFAFWGGLLWSFLGALLGSSCIYFAVRQLGLREVMLRKHPAWQKMTDRLQHNTVPAVILFRQIPMPGMLTNIILGLSPIRRREFFLGSCIGLLPEAVPMVLIGSGLRKEELGHTILYLFASVALFIGIWIAWGAWTRRAAAKEGVN